MSLKKFVEIYVSIVAIKKMKEERANRVEGTGGWKRVKECRE
jgi:hypothetical protein